MPTVAHALYLDSEFGALTELPSAGTDLENPYVYDSSAREIKAMADQGLVRIVDEKPSGGRADLISRLTFQRLR